MIEKLHIVSKVVLIIISTYYLWYWISRRIGLYLLEHTRPNSIQEVMYKATIKSQPQAKRNAIRDINTKLLIIVGCLIVLWIIW